MNKRLIGLWMVIVVIFGILLGQNILNVSNLDIYYFNTQTGYLENHSLAKLSYNRVTFYLNRYLNNFFTGTDPNYFFFGGHPRETPGGNNDLKISYWLIPFFVLSVYEQLINKEWRLLVLYGLSLVAVAFFSVDSMWWALAPFWYATVVYPFKELWKDNKPLANLPLRKGQEKNRL